MPSESPELDRSGAPTDSGVAHGARTSSPRRGGTGQARGRVAVLFGPFRAGTFGLVSFPRAMPWAGMSPPLRGETGSARIRWRTPDGSRRNRLQPDADLGEMAGRPFRSDGSERCPRPGGRTQVRFRFVRRVPVGPSLSPP